VYPGWHWHPQNWKHIAWHVLPEYRFVLVAHVQPPLGSCANAAANNSNNVIIAEAVFNSITKLKRNHARPFVSTMFPSRA
jgi:hypothetical protein